MLSKDELIELLHSTESYRVERTISTGNMDKFQEAICAFANDLPNSRKNGYLIIGANDDGSLCGMKVDDNLMKKISAIRSDGNILPLPVMSVERFEFLEGDLLVAEVMPSLVPPVRYRGRTFVRIGPRKDIATEAEERILFERRTSFMATFDAMPCFGAKLEDVNLELFKENYQRKVVPTEVLAQDSHPVEEQMAALGMYDLDHNCPTYAAVILFGKNPRKFMPGAYVQYVCFKGKDKTSDIVNERQFEDCYCTLLPKLESLLDLSVVKNFPVQISSLREEMKTNYPNWAIRELLMNACMHRDLQSNMPLRFYEYADHLEIMNAGGLYGNARPENFPNVNDYRNPVVAGAMKVLGYVNMYNRGIRQVQEELRKNGNEEAAFKVDFITAFSVEVKANEIEEVSNNVAGDAEQVPSKYRGGTVEVPRKFYPSTAQVEKLVLSMTSEYLSITEMMELCGINHRETFRKKYINPALEEEAIERMYAEQPYHPQQKYRLTEKAKVWKLENDNNKQQ